MTPRTLIDRRTRLCYLALYYAIQGDEKRSEQVRRMVRRMSAPTTLTGHPMPGAPVPA